MIISASRRTDIPAFFSDWFYNRIEKGFVLVRNPLNMHQISRIDIRPDIVDCIVFWTKNPARFIGRLDKIAAYNYYFQYTVTGYGQKLEPNVPPFEASLSYFKALSGLVGANRIIWRYDPIIITDELDLKYHISHFKYIAERMAGLTMKCVISFVDYYGKTKKNMANIKYEHITEKQMIELSQHLMRIGKQYDIVLTSCAEEVDLKQYGIDHGKCIDDKLIEEIAGYPLDIAKDKTQRAECGCMASIDIGAYNTCQHGCLYCYANYDINRVRLNYAEHNGDSELLYGMVTPQDKISDRKVISCKKMRTGLF